MSSCKVFGSSAKLLILLEGRLQELILLLDFLLQLAGRIAVVLGGIVDGHGRAKRQGGCDGGIEIPSRRLLGAVNDMGFMHDRRIIGIFVPPGRISFEGLGVADIGGIW
jgi:hypothetical protein